MASLSLHASIENSEETDSSQRDRGEKDHNTLDINMLDTSNILDTEMGTTNRIRMGRRSSLCPEATTADSASNLKEQKREDEGKKRDTIPT